MLLNPKHVNKEYNEKESKYVRVNGMDDIDSKAAQEADKVHDKSRKGLVHKQTRMGIEVDASATLPSGDMATKQVWLVITVIQDAESSSTESAVYDPSLL